VDTKELTQRLSRHYIKPSDPLPGGVFLTEVMSPAQPPTFENGGYRTRRVDALYMGFTAARGRMLEGHELKVSRSDWLHELSQPQKADWWFERTHRWWVVAGDDTIVDPNELPPGWGLMIPTSKTRTKLRVVAAAALREPLVDFGLLHEITKKMDVVRRDAELVAQREIDVVVRTRVAEVIEERRAREQVYAERDLAKLREAVATFEQASGVSLVSYQAGNIGEAVATALAEGNAVRNRLRDLVNIQQRLHSLAEQADRDVEVLRAGA
jgi:hypothetical protein